MPLLIGPLQAISSQCKDVESAAIVSLEDERPHRCVPEAPLDYRVQVTEVLDERGPTGIGQRTNGQHGLLMHSLVLCSEDLQQNLHALVGECQYGRLARI